MSFWLLKNGQKLVISSNHTETGSSSFKNKRFFLNFLYFKFRCLKLPVHMSPWVMNIFSKYEIYHLISFDFIGKTFGSVLFETVIRFMHFTFFAYHCFKKDRTQSFCYKIKTIQVVYIIFWENIYNSWGHMYRKF